MKNVKISENIKSLQLSPSVLEDLFKNIILKIKK